MKTFYASLLALGICLGLTFPAMAEYPAKPIMLMTAFNAGGGSDVSHRLLEKFAKGVFDQPIVVTYKAGAGGEIGWTWLVGAKADGYTIGGVDLPHIVLQPMLRPEGQPGYKTEQLSPLCGLVYDANVVMVPEDGPYKTFKDLIEYAKANPGVVKMADSGVGAAPNVAAKAFEKYFDISFDFYTYDGAPECVTAVETNEVDATFLQPTPATASVKAGTLSMIGVLSDERLASFPDTPTIMETFGEEYNLVMKGFVALSAPAGTPDDVVAALRDLMGKAVESDEYKTQIESLGMQYITLYGDELNTFINEQMAFYKDICADIDING